MFMHIFWVVLLLVLLWVASGIVIPKRTMFNGHQRFLMRVFVMILIMIAAAQWHPIYERIFGRIGS